MMARKPQRCAAVLVAALFVVAGCGGGSDAGSPVAPGAVPGPGGTPGATVSGTVSAGTSSAVRVLSAGLGGFKVSVVGSDLAAVTGSNGAFTLRGVPPGHVRLEFQGTGVQGELGLEDVREGERIALSVVVSGSTIELAQQQRVTGSQSQLEGTIESVQRPSRTFTIGTTTVVVQEDIPITMGFRALEYSDLVVGARVHVKGALDGDTLSATSILVQQTGLDAVKSSGVISGVGGTCPVATFELGSASVSVNASTIYVRGSCDDLVDGATVEIKGLRREDGSILATMVRFKTATGDEEEAQAIEVSGALSGLSGRCPALTFTVGGRQVRTTGATQFATSCGHLTNGQTVTVSGRVTGNGMVLASQVSGG